MKDANAILSTAKEIILLESNAIANLGNLLETSFIDFANFIFILKSEVYNKVNNYVCIVSFNKPTKKTLF